MIRWIEFAAAMISLIGMVFVIEKSRWGYALWFVANVLWATYAAKTGATWLFLTQIAFAVMSCIGFVRWSEDNTREEQVQ